ncbi:GNAT family N-acetyltransferase [Phyllobacterium sp. YR531]|uniref:GNAT family N-acetyltransferase n=1 Tax=Phyllobacterium sp. YR531 TaxID=1144343 RepID=UPI00026F905B|nr:GNAT family N-acetyltransferase [Phyllobacterium sp. YR531]EJM99221.1 acetyltransferase [Phyllobacterium sp. YR531]
MSFALTQVRQIEALGFRAWPASSVHYDGSWAIRTTKKHPSKRLNSVNPLDPGDTDNIEQRVAAAVERFRASGRKCVFRLSPLAPKQLESYLASSGWVRFDDSLIMIADLATVDLSDAKDLVVQPDIGGFVDASLHVQGEAATLKSGLIDVIGSIKPARGLFTIEDSGVPVSTAICVSDGAMAGLFGIATAGNQRRRGLGRAIVKSALKWAVQQGATKAWLQVEAGNAGAIALYQSMGFREAYQYAYWQAAEA